MIQSIVLALAFSSFALVAIIYGLYIVLILRNRKIGEYRNAISHATAESPNPETLPTVTIIMPAYNEEASIPAKFRNLVALRYPIGKLEVLLVDDCSTDRTCETAEKSLAESGLRGSIIKNDHRMGANASYNTGVPLANGSLILRTDVDVLIEVDALEKAVRVVSTFENVGGITGTMIPVTDRVSNATGLERSYRGLFDQMSTAESALYSTFFGGGGFALLTKSSFSPILVNRGSTDANISLSIIKRGLRYLYIPQTFSHEMISCRLGEQMRQKVRRASRMIQSVLLNRDMLFDRKLQEFGMLIFPLRFAMLVFCPAFVFLGLFSTFLLFLSWSVIAAGFSTLAFCGFLFLGTRMRMGPLNSAASFLVHQLYLLLGLAFVGKKRSVWKSVERSLQI